MIGLGVADGLGLGLCHVVPPSSRSEAVVIDDLNLYQTQSHIAVPVSSSPAHPTGFEPDLHLRRVALYPAELRASFCLRGAYADFLRVRSDEQRVASSGVAPWATASPYRRRLDISAIDFPNRTPQQAFQDHAGSRSAVDLVP